MLCCLQHVTRASVRYAGRKWCISPVPVLLLTELSAGRVSTVFLGLNHQFGIGLPLVFETMVFGGPSDGDCHRYSTWEQAEKGHMAVVTKLRKISSLQLFRYWLKKLFQGDNK